MRIVLLWYILVGEVYKPGLVELKPGQRVIDAVELAGGLKKKMQI